MNPAFDFETRSAAGYVWNEEEECWEGPPGAAECGLALVGVKNYVNHPTFQVLCLSYDLRDDAGVRLWVPGMPDPVDLLRHVARKGILSAWNVSFELEVWNSYCVSAFGWPPLVIDQLICDMAAARAWTLPGGLANAGEVLKLSIQKDKGGSDLIKKFTIPRQPTKKNQAMWNEPDDPDAPPKKVKVPVQTTIEAIREPLYTRTGEVFVPPSSWDDDIPF
jgi:hypothetical protein